jgi:hypothetical protein
MHLVYCPCWWLVLERGEQIQVESRILPDTENESPSIQRILQGLFVHHISRLFSWHLDFILVRRVFSVSKATLKWE